MNTKILSAIALALAPSSASAQTNRDVFRAPFERAVPPIARICRLVPARTIAAISSITGTANGGNLTLTMRGNCIQTKPLNLSISIFPATPPPGVLPLGIVGSYPLETWSTNSAIYSMKLWNMAEIHTTIPVPAFTLGFSSGNRTFVAKLTEAEFITLQNGGQVLNPATH